MDEQFKAQRISRPPKLDGRLDDWPWTHARRSAPFVDMETGAATLLQTQAAVLWDDQALYVGFWVEEPYPTAHQTERDSLIFRENDVELFIDGGDSYYELEINALGILYEVFFIWRDAYRRGSRFDLPEFDVVDRKALSFGGNFDRTEEHFWSGTHPRGTRWAFLDWDFPGLRSAAHVDGKLNDMTSRSKGWTAEVALPWSGMGHLADGRALPPQDGDEWRMFFGRFQKISIGSSDVQAAWCLTPHGKYDTHIPERFTPVRFVNELVSP